MGSVQSLKALLTGRRGAGPMQPYRELRRLWRKTVVSPEETGPLYRVAPALSAAALLGALVVIPIGAAAPDGPAGRDALVVAGLLATARLAVGLGAFDTRSGFALQGVSRDLLFAAAGDALLAATLGALAVMAGSSDLRMIAAATAGGDVWRGPAQVLLLAAFATRDGGRDRPPADRQPRHAPRADDDPRGPAAGVRRTRPGACCSGRRRRATGSCWCCSGHSCTAPGRAPGARSPSCRRPLPWGASRSPITETMVAKVRIYRAPRMLAVGVAVALLATAARSLGGIG